MADYYWVGTTTPSNWTTAANWATSSGGSTKYSVPPTSADNVIFDNASYTGTFTVTVDATANCADFTVSITDPLKKMTLAGSAALNVYGSWTNPISTYYAATYSGALTFAATTTGKTITTNAVGITAGSGSTVNINGVGGEWTLGGALSTAGSYQHNAGSFVTNNNTITVSINFQFNNNTNTRSFTAGSSTINIGGSFFAINQTNLTFNAGTSSFVNGNSAGGGIYAQTGLTFYDFSWTGTGGGSFVPITGANTFNNFSVTSRASNGLRMFTFGDNQTINGTLTLGAANTAVRRISLHANDNNGSSQTLITGVTRTITVNGSVAALSDVDFQDITAAGTAGTPWTGTRLGDGGGNSNITFVAGGNKYWYSATGAGGNWSAAQWETTAGGTAPSVNNFPLPQDTVIMRDTGLNAGQTLTLDATFNIGAIDFSSRTATMTFATGTFSPLIHKDLTLVGSAILTMTGTGSAFFLNSSSVQNITNASQTLTQPVYISAGTGTFRLVDNMTLGATLTTTFVTGTLDLGTNNRTLSTGLFASSYTLTRAISFGASGAITLTGTSTSGNITIWSAATLTNFSYTGTSSVTLSGASTANTRTISHGSSSSSGTEARAVSFTVSAGSDTIATTATSYFKNLVFSGTFTGTLSNTARNIYGNLTFKTGMTLTTGTSATTFAGTSGTQAFTSAGLTVDFPVTVAGVGCTAQLADNLTLGSTRALALTAGTLDVNGKTASIGNFATSGALTRVLAFGTSGTITVVGSGATAWSATGTGLTSTGTTSTISMTSASAKTFAGGGFVYAATLNQGGSGALTITGNNTFAGMTNTVQPATVTFTASTTTTFTGAFALSGTAANLITVNSATPGTRYTLTYPTVVSAMSLSYTNISDSSGYENSYWQALQSNGNVNGGNNLGWIFAPVVQSAWALVGLNP